MRNHSRYLFLALLLLALLLAACGEPPTAPPEQPPTPTPASPTLTPPPPTLTPRPPTAPPTTAAPLTPVPLLTRPPRTTPLPSPTPWVVQPTPYAPQEALPAGLPPVVYAVQRTGQPAQLWTLRYEEGLLREELLLDLAPEAVENIMTPEFYRGYGHIGYARVEKVVFSPDGRYIALGVDRTQFLGTTLVFSVTDGKAFLPPPPAHESDGFLAWIPGREWFVWQGAYGANWGAMALDGSSYTWYTRTHDVMDAVVLPDGNRVIFSSIPSQDVWLGAIDVDGSNLTIYPVPDPLPGRRARNLSLSPNGQTCAFTWNRQVSYRGEGQIWVMNADGSNQRALGPADTYDYDLAWAPDGRTVVFVRWDSPNSPVFSTDRAERVSSLWLIDVESGQERLLLSSQGRYAHWAPRWLPDGAGLLLLSTRGGAADLWFVRPDGTGLQQLTRQGGLAGEIAVPGR